MREVSRLYQFMLDLTDLAAPPVFCAYESPPNLLAFDWLPRNFSHPLSGFPKRDSTPSPRSSKCLRQRSEYTGFRDGCLKSAPPFGGRLKRLSRVGTVARGQNP
jgi:hypothetical protein